MNVGFPRVIEPTRVVLVTPALHRLYHSSAQPLIDRNFGQVFQTARIFGTYVLLRGDAPPNTGWAGSPASATRRWPACC